MSLSTTIWKIKRALGFNSPSHNRIKRVSKATKIKRVRKTASRLGLKVVSKTSGRRKTYSKPKKRRTYKAKRKTYKRAYKTRSRRR